MTFKEKPSKETLKHMFGLAGSDYIIGDNSHPFVYVVMNADPINERKGQAWDFLAFVEHVSHITWLDIEGLDQFKSERGNDFLSDIGAKTREKLDELIALMRNELSKATPKPWLYSSILDALAEFVLCDEVGDLWSNGYRGGSDCVVLGEYEEIRKSTRDFCTTAAKKLIAYRWPDAFEEAFLSSFFVKAYSDWLNSCAMACLFSLEVIRENHIFRVPDSDNRFERLFRAIQESLSDSRRLLALVRNYLIQLDGDDLLDEYGLINKECNEVNKYVPKRNARGAGRGKLESNEILVAFIRELPVSLREEEKAVPT